MRISFVLAIALTTTLAAAAEQDRQSVGKVSCVIVGAKGAIEAEATAAKELARHLGKITGTTPLIVAESAVPGASRKIFVGWTEFAARHGADGRTLGEEEWIIRTVGEDLVITGGRPRGTLYGVYEFLEHELGCHWLDENTEVVPKIAELKWATIDRRGQPAFRVRAISGGYYAVDGELYYKDQAYRARNKVNGTECGPLPAKYGFAVCYGSGGNCHTFAEYAKNFPHDHPEYLSKNLQDKRIGATDGSGPGGICLMHPEVRRLVLARLKEFIARDRAAAAKGNYPPPTVYDISQNDNHWMCQCPECKAMSQREGSESGPLVDFINAIADGIRKEYPDVLVQTFAYSITEKPPKTLRPRDNVMIRVAELNAEWRRESDLFHPVTHKVNRAQFERLQGWSRIAKNLAEWDYWIQYSPNDKFVTPYAPTACIGPDLEAFYRHNVRQVYVECENPERTSFYALKRWLGFQLMQNPVQPVEPLLATFMSGYYGPAAVTMREYLRLMETSIAAVDANMSAMKNYARPYLTLAFYLQCQRLLDQAEAQCASAPQALLHVRRERIPVDCGLFHMWVDLTRDPPSGVKLPFDREMLLKRYEQYRLEQMAAFRTAAAQAKGKQEISEEIAKMREFALTDHWKQQPPPEMRVPSVSGAPVDGDPSKVDWSKAAEVVPWRAAEGHSTDQKLTGHLLHDGRCLYIKLEHVCNGTKLLTAEQAGTGDGWELFFAPRRCPPYRQLMIDARGQAVANDWENLIGKCKPKDWTAGARIISRPQSDRWTVFVSIPLEKLVPGGVKIGREFYANFYRFVPQPRQILLAWSPTFDNNFHLLDRLGKLTLE